jgi:hypothetical protein
MTGEVIHVWFKNLRHVHERIMVRYLRKKGWVVFWLDKESRVCNEGTCWLQLYEDAMKYEEENKTSKISLFSLKTKSRPQQL